MSPEQRANEILAKVRELIETIPGYGFIGAAERRRMRANGAVPDRFLNTVAVALDASPALASSADITGAELRSVIAFCNAFRAFATELQLLGQGVLETVESTRGKAGGNALRVYNIARSFNRPADREVLIPHIADMKKTLARGRKSRTSDPQAAKAKAAAKPGDPAGPATPGSPTNLVVVDPAAKKAA